MNDDRIHQLTDSELEAAYSDEKASCYGASEQVEPLPHNADIDSLRDSDLLRRLRDEMKRRGLM